MPSALCAMPSAPLCPKPVVETPSAKMPFAVTLSA
jgi:hypothetical protein